MPSSFVDSFPPIVKLLTEITPKRVIDIGPGWGKYGLACREYLPTLETLHAIEVRQGRLPTQDAIYDWVYTGDVRSYSSAQFWSRWDLALLIDVIEHMSIADGHRVLDTILSVGCKILVSTPKVWDEQHDDKNPYETHICLWDWSEFGQHGIKYDISTIDAIIYLLVGQ